MENNIILSGNDAKRFYQDMTHIDKENQKRINDFIKEIDNDIESFSKEDDGTIKVTIKGDFSYGKF